MFGLGHLTRGQRLMLGMFVLLLVDVIWVVSSEVTKYVMRDKQYGKPFFSTYLSTSMFTLYLSGFIFWRNWWIQCRKNGGSPIFVPLRSEDKVPSGTESDDTTNFKNFRSVRFSNLSEVRHLSELQAEDATLARMSFAAYNRAEEVRIKAASRLTVRQIAKVAGLFCILFFFCHLAIEEALHDADTGLVHVLSSTSGVFTLILAAIFPSTSGDRITLSKIVAVIISIGGVVLVTFSNKEFTSDVPLGALWSLLGALLYAIYLVLLRRRVDNEDKLNMPMFLGFVGVFAVLLFWPGFFIVHFTKTESFEWPNSIQWIFLVTNGLIGTVLSELLWLWACFLTSTLVATLALGLIIPMTMIADMYFKEASYNWMFYTGIGPLFLSFFGVSILCFYENWDPVYVCIKRSLQFICRRRIIARIRDMDMEQTETLIGINSDRVDS
ncbi:hypothetical protein CAPTEDRAFT_20302 [Capitella teleta]|uniref:Solute carrier family 35 member F5 n=1 Tax=Capitella teleta TaxID=283909 RepID=R7TMT6_CAPTE|nr:hypothetical protein CAPTEDRAFT_20302 [Capitella teleta]|eukprot:ELT94817.1 hypothetical protein CAPTEDRAFT_20302 [Capitella teleta]